MSDQSGNDEAAHMPDSSMACWLIRTYKTSEPAMRVFRGQQRPAATGTLLEPGGSSHGTRVQGEIGWHASETAACRVLHV